MDLYSFKNYIQIFTLPILFWTYKDLSKIGRSIIDILFTKKVFAADFILAWPTTFFQYIVSRIFQYLSLFLYKEQKTLSGWNFYPTRDMKNAK